MKSPRYQLLAEHLGTGLTLSYLALVAIGMFNSVLGYRHFGINILDYAEASDFLLVPFLAIGMAMLWVFVSADAYQRILAGQAMRGEGHNVIIELTNGTRDGGSTGVNPSPRSL